jgi:hypothetical protein
MDNELNNALNVVSFSDVRDSFQLVLEVALGIVDVAAKRSVGVS